jgi:formylglycine-generating enzyme required for sulfatase activity
MPLRFSDILRLPLLGLTTPLFPTAVCGAGDFVTTIPGTAVGIEMVAIPGGDLQLGPGEDLAIDAFYLSRTEIPWEAYDVFVFALDRPSAEEPPGIDAFARPSRPYVSYDRGFGHNGYPALSMSLRGAQAFCEFLSAKTGVRWRLPSKLEWEYACRAGLSSPFGFERGEEALIQHAWFSGNAAGKTHPVGALAPNAFGLHDMNGNASEWCAAEGGEPTTCGGSYRDGPSGVGCDARAKASPSWNQSDPQLPKSTWWLADAPFVGFRVVCEAPPAGARPLQSPPERAQSPERSPQQPPKQFPQQFPQQFQ